eukprot:TRINITY_DN3676_c0_g1_i2.p1 TRINITY_DN3676_c0_g1~~TRINITY_DN3676_c0_g1_i2.p1  ORF type:complete len:591 (-),score=154.18 TRINITY_DN3676_c0_g1_i2:171-1943(-)
MKKSGAFCKFETASQLLSDIESLLEAELEIDSNYDNTVKVKSKRKRGGPFLIKPIGTSKSRRILGDMVYNPDLQIWEGGEETNRLFNRTELSVIMNKGRQDRPKAVGKMIWDPKDRKWIGNDEDVYKFDKRPGLISGRNRADVPRLVGGMRYDVQQRKWIGNEDILAAFGDDEFFSSDDAGGFQVGNEFKITPAMLNAYAQASSNHQQSTSGWWSEKARMDLFVIRTMAILRIVYDVKSRKSVSEQDVDMTNARTIQREESWEKDIGPFKGTIKLKLPNEERAADLEFLDEEPKQEPQQQQPQQQQQQQPEPPKPTISEPPVSTPTISAPTTTAKTIGGKSFKDDDSWDDFDDSSLNKIKGGLAKTGLVLSPALAAGKGRMQTISLAQFNASGGIVPPPAQVATPTASIPAPTSAPAPDSSVKSNPSPIPSPALSPIPKSIVKPVLEEETSGLDIPANGKLVLKIRSPALEPRPAHIEDEGKSNAPAPSPSPKPDDIIEEEEEDDWKDVKIPASLNHLRLLGKITNMNKKTNTQTDAKLAAHKEKDGEWDKDLPSVPEKLVLSPEKAHKKEEDEWNDVEIPAGFAFKLRR